MKRALALLAAGVLVLAAVGLVRALQTRSRQFPVEAGPALPPPPPPAEAASRLARGLRFRTISSDSLPEAEFLALRRHLERSFPRVHAALTREVVAEQSLLYTWPGRDPDLPPVVCMGHLDVVPVEPGTERAWTHPPFGGVIADGAVWGRGSLDVKESVYGLLEAAEALLAGGFTPERTLYFAFGHNEEIGGDGAATIARRLMEAGMRPALVLDEGMAVTEGIVPGIRAPVALIGVAEKGEVSLALTLETESGHSAMPEPHTAAGLLGRAVGRLEAHRLPARLRGPGEAMFRALAPEMAFPMRAAFANLWLTRRLIEGQLERAPATNALIRTTTAVTLLRSGVQANVIPRRARALVDFRILPGDTVEGIVAHVRRTVADDRIRIDPVGTPRAPSPVSPTEAPGFRLLAGTIRREFPGSVVAPGLVLGGTDSRHFTDLTDAVYRFTPVRVGPGDLERFHGVNERIPVQDYAGAIRFYMAFLAGAGAKDW